MASSSFLQVKGLRKHRRIPFSSRTLLSPQMEIELSLWKLSLSLLISTRVLCLESYLAEKRYLKLFFLMNKQMNGCYLVTNLSITNLKFSIKYELFHI